ncbi:helix-turn-helix domain-containing protein [Streptomyces himalayensis]|uniref:Helix-turn-helix domain-containing protein n=1 Tax=Streptomyces himalayensis subsp. himalayensis TaxID=2756131 RepID=A0A7W0DGC6_9ACTN|nr:helix-turn-helix transcriptional regulator [Streptomyces himalayensis]MBA2944325.1 helix-turn-helix domain-containing protein [Streptomyces himalayensis subsp. himalayensis]
MGLRGNPTYRQRRYGAEVRAIRERAGFTAALAAEVMGMNASHISTVESGRTGLSADRLRRLAAAVGSEDSTYVEALIDLGQRTGKGWWSEYRHVLGAPHLDLAELEDMACVLRTYEPLFVPGLLQTRPYVEAIHRGGYRSASQAEQEAQVEFRVQRQRVLTGERAPRLHAIIHEAALSASLGDRNVMRGQLLHLIEMSRLPHITIQILPFDGPVGFGTGFVMIEPQVAELGTVIVSHIEQSLYLDGADTAAKYSDWFAKLANVALPPIDAATAPEARTAKDSLGLIQRLLYPLL